MIKVEHSIFALPFAMVGMMYAAKGWPGWRIFLLILLAMVSARSAAMAFNRIADAPIDALNPRTAGRALPKGELALSRAWLFFIGSCIIFFFAAALLNKLTLLLSPVALFLLVFYSYTKRFTPLCHLFVGLSLGLAPAAAWVAVRGIFGWEPVFWLFAVTFWTAGFDVLYALQDEGFDKAHGLYSIPAAIGRTKAIIFSRTFHILAFVFLVGGGLILNVGTPYFLGCLFAGGLLMYEQSLVKPSDISKIDLAFFTLNGYISAGFFFFALVDVVTR